MSLNIPVLALSLIGVLMVVAGLFVASSNFLVLIGIVAVLLAYLLNEGSKRRA